MCSVVEKGAYHHYATLHNHWYAWYDTCARFRTVLLVVGACTAHGYIADTVVHACKIVYINPMWDLITFRKTVRVCSLHWSRRKPIYCHRYHCFHGGAMHCKLGCRFESRANAMSWLLRFVQRWDVFVDSRKVLYDSWRLFFAEIGCHSSTEVTMMVYVLSVFCWSVFTVVSSWCVAT